MRSIVHVYIFLLWKYNWIVFALVKSLNEYIEEILGHK